MKSQKKAHPLAPAPLPAVGSEPALPKTVLPAQRRDLAAHRPEKPLNDEPIRIEPRLLREVTEPLEEPTRLEVTELGTPATRLERPKPNSVKAPRQVVFQEKSTEALAAREDLGEKEDWGQAHTSSSRWLLKAGVLVTTVLIAAVLLIPLFNYFNQTKPHRASPSLATVTEESNTEGMKDIETMLSQKNTALRIHTAFVNATKPEDILPLIRDSAALQETIQKYWRPIEGRKGWDPSTGHGFEVADFGQNVCAILRGSLPDRSPYTAYFLSKNGKLLLDWKASTGFGTATFAQLEKATGDPSEIRGILSYSEYYSPTWPETEYQSYRFLSPDLETALWCYVPLKSPIADSVYATLSKKRGSNTSDERRNVTLKLERGPDSARPNQWLIQSLLHPDWIAP